MMTPLLNSKSTLMVRQNTSSCCLGVLPKAEVRIVYLSSIVFQEGKSLVTADLLNMTVDLPGILPQL
jgi:hypothetical protein